MGCRALIELSFEPSHHRLICIPHRTGHSGRRHHACAQLSHNQFPLFGLLADVCCIQFVQFQASRFQPLVMADNAVLVQQSALACRVSNFVREGCNLGTSCLSSPDGQSDNVSESTLYLHDGSIRATKPVKAAGWLVRSITPYSRYCNCSEVRYCVRPPSVVASNAYRESRRRATFAGQFRVLRVLDFDKCWAQRARNCTKVIGRGQTYNTLHDRALEAQSAR